LPSDARSLWESLNARGTPGGRLHGTRGVIALADLAALSAFGPELEDLRGRSVLIITQDQLTAALALLELDGVARRLVLCTPDLAAQYLPGIIQVAQCEACVRDVGSAPADVIGLPATTLTPALSHKVVGRRSTHPTEWILLTSGTTGAPKLVLHTLASLTSALAGAPPPPEPLVWSTFYDIRRYGGLQIFLRGVHNGSLVLSDPAEATGDFLTRAQQAGVTHISGTPSHWRKALMSGTTANLSPRYARLSGEVADQAVLDSLRHAYPGAIVAHAFASTEAGVAFEVRDGLAGFPVSLVGAAGARVELRVAAETLQIRSAGNAERYLGEGMEAIRGPDGFVDTGDRVEAREGRYYFMGRRGGVINVGGLKVHPEEVEAVLNAHPWVQMSLVKARRSPITGAMVTADVVLAEASAAPGPRPAAAELTRELTESCRRKLAAHKVPAMIRIVPALDISPSGKLVRPLA
jgi:acyl-coenzyme A synthetase/AMP-(fatty) acid ligase